MSPRGEAIGFRSSPSSGPENTSETEPQIGSFASVASGGVGTGPLNIPRFGRADIFYASGGSGNRTFTAVLRLGGSVTITIPPGGAPLAFDGRLFSTVSINSVASGANWAIVAQDAAPTFGTGSSITVLSAMLQDGAGNTTDVAFNNGSAAPATGMARARVTANNAVTITLSDGTTTKNVQAADGASWFEVDFPVVQGTTYTFAGAGITLLGGKIVVTPG